MRSAEGKAKDIGITSSVPMPNPGLKGAAIGSDAIAEVCIRKPSRAVTGRDQKTTKLMSDQVKKPQPAGEKLWGFLFALGERAAGQEKAMAKTIMGKCLASS
jgi:hypothetical protein